MKQYSEDEFVLAARLGYNACLADLLGKDMNQTDIALESNILCVCLGVDYKFNPETFRREVIFEKMASYKELFDYFTLGFVICLATLKNRGALASSDTSGMMIYLALTSFTMSSNDVISYLKEHDYGIERNAQKMEKYISDFRIHFNLK